MFDLFSDLFAARSTRLDRLDPRLRLVGGLTVLVMLAFCRELPLPAAVFVVCLAALTALRLPPKVVLLRLATPAAMVAVLVVIQAFTGAGQPLATWEVAGLRLAVTQDGLWRGAALALRVFAAVSVLILFSFTLPAHQFFQALRWFRVPALWVEMALLMYRHIFVLLDQASDVAVAQRVRLGYASFTHSAASIGALAGTVLVRSFDQSVRTHEAMLLRGYTGTIPIGPLRPLKRLEWLLLALLPLLAAALLMAGEGQEALWP